MLAKWCSSAQRVIKLKFWILSKNETPRVSAVARWKLKMEISLLEMVGPIGNRRVFCLPCVSIGYYTAVRSAARIQPISTRCRFANGELYFINCCSAKPNGVADAKPIKIPNTILPGRTDCRWSEKMAKRIKRWRRQFFISPLSGGQTEPRTQSTRKQTRVRVNERARAQQPKAIEPLSWR